MSRQRCHKNYHEYTNTPKVSSEEKEKSRRAIDRRLTCAISKLSQFLRTLINSSPKKLNLRSIRRPHNEAISFIKLTHPSCDNVNCSNLINVNHSARANMNSGRYVRFYLYAMYSLCAIKLRVVFVSASTIAFHRVKSHIACQPLTKRSLFARPINRLDILRASPRRVFDSATLNYREAGYARTPPRKWIGIMSIRGIIDSSGD